MTTPSGGRPAVFRLPSAAIEAAALAGYTSGDMAAAFRITSAAITKRSRIHGFALPDLPATDSPAEWGAAIIAACQARLEAVTAAVAAMTREGAA